MRVLVLLLLLIFGLDESGEDEVDIFVEDLHFQSCKRLDRAAA